MEHYSVVIFLLAVMIGLSAFAEKIRIPYPIIMIAAGIAIGFIPSIPNIELEPEVVFLIFLPPLLYDAAYKIPFGDFKTHFNTINALAISLVFLTACGIAVVSYYLIPGMTWPLAFVLGSILSATDAVSAISITKGLGLSHQTTTILEGESLVNDASALVAYRYAVLAVGGTTFVFWEASLQFILVLGGGFLVGMALAKLLSVILKRVHRNAMVTLGFMLLMPFVAYQVAEEIHVSGVIAVVVLGLMIARFGNQNFAPALQEQAKTIWDVIVFLLNGFIFILIGIQFPEVMETVDGNIWLYILYAFVITVVAFLLRFARVLGQQRGLEKGFKSPRNKNRISEHALFDFKTSLIISWSGMRGIVSLATAIALPLTLSNGEIFPQRNVIIFISVVVVLISIIGQGLTLPWVVKRFEK